MDIDDLEYNEIINAIENSDRDELSDILDTGVQPHPYVLYGSYHLSPIAKAVEFNSYDCFLELIDADRYASFGANADRAYKAAIHIAYVVASTFPNGNRVNFLNALLTTGQLNFDFEISLGPEPRAVRSIVEQVGTDAGKAFLAQHSDVQGDPSQLDSSDDEDDADPVKKDTPGSSI